MKLRSVVYAVAALSILFLAAMAYLYFAGAGERGSSASVLDDVRPTPARLADSGRTASGTAGKLIIAYAGDYDGSLEPCG